MEDRGWRLGWRLRIEVALLWLQWRCWLAICRLAANERRPMIALRYE